MPIVRNIINHVTVETAKGERKCHRHASGKHKHVIQVGELCLVIDTPIMGKQSYCAPAGQKILDNVHVHVSELKKALGS